MVGNTRCKLLKTPLSIWVWLKRAWVVPKKNLFSQIDTPERAETALSVRRGRS